MEEENEEEEQEEEEEEESNMEEGYMLSLPTLPLKTKRLILAHQTHRVRQSISPKNLEAVQMRRLFQTQYNGPYF